MTSSESRPAPRRLPAAHLGLALALSLGAAALVAPQAIDARRGLLEGDAMVLQSFGAKNPGCVEWSDNCSTCQRGGDGKAKCSTVGIACVSGDLACKVEKPK